MTKRHFFFLFLFFFSFLGNAQEVRKGDRNLKLLSPVKKIIYEANRGETNLLSQFEENVWHYKIYSEQTKAIKQEETFFFQGKIQKIFFEDRGIPFIIVETKKGFHRFIFLNDGKNIYFGFQSK